MITVVALVVAALTSAITLVFVVHQTRTKTIDQIELEHARSELERLRGGLEHLLPVLSRSTDAMAKLAEEGRHEAATTGGPDPDRGSPPGGQGGQGTNGGGADPAGCGDRTAGSDAGGGDR